MGCLGLGEAVAGVMQVPSTKLVELRTRQLERLAGWVSD